MEKYTTNALNPEKKIGYLKMPKTGSGTMLNILLRYGLKNNLNFVLPKEGIWLDGPHHFHRDMIKNTLWEKAALKYQMFVAHTRWNHEEIANILNDRDDVFYFTMLRDPEEHFISSWDFFRGRLRVKGSKNLEKYVNTGIRNDPSIYVTLGRRSIPFNYSLVNQQLYALGMEHKDIADFSQIQTFVKNVEKLFDLVLINDGNYFNYSMILLKNALQWEYQDMINFQQLHKAQKKSPLSSEARTILRGD